MLLQNPVESSSLSQLCQNINTHVGSLHSSAHTWELLTCHVPRPLARGISLCHSHLLLSRSERCLGKRAAEDELLAPGWIYSVYFAAIPQVSSGSWPGSRWGCWLDDDALQLLRTFAEAPFCSQPAVSS